MTAAIRETYSVCGKDKQIIRANPHSVQGGLVLWAEFARIPPEEICRTTTWSPPCSFAHHHWVDLAAKSPNFAAEL